MRQEAFLSVSGTLGLLKTWLKKRANFQQIVQRQLDIHKQINEVGPLPHTIHKR